MSKSLAEKLADQSHLSEQPDEEEMRRAVEESTVNPEADKADEDKEEEKLEKDPRKKQIYPFSFRYTDDNGKPWKGDFVNHVLDIGTKGRVGVTLSGLNGGQPINSIPRETLLRHSAIAHMMFSLKERPDWAKNLAALFDEEVIYALFAEVAEHQRIFLGRPPIEEGGQE